MIEVIIEAATVAGSSNIEQTRLQLHGLKDPPGTIADRR